MLCPDLKNVFFGKIHWAPSEILEVAEAIFEVAEAKFWISFIFNGFRGRLTSATSATSEGAQGIFSKITFLKSVRSNEKDEVCHSFVVKIFH